MRIERGCPETWLSGLSFFVAKVKSYWVISYLTQLWEENSTYALNEKQN